MSGRKCQVENDNNSNNKQQKEEDEEEDNCCISRLQSQPTSAHREHSTKALPMIHDDHWSCSSNCCLMCMACSSPFLPPPLPPWPSGSYSRGLARVCVRATRLQSSSSEQASQERQRQQAISPCQRRSERVCNQPTSILLRNLHQDLQVLANLFISPLRFFIVVGVERLQRLPPLKCVPRANLERPNGRQQRRPRYANRDDVV